MALAGATSVRSVSGVALNAPRMSSLLSGGWMMPISPERRKLYPRNWKEISLRVRREAGFRCQWCDAGLGEAHPVTGSKVVLSVHHLNHLPEDCRRANLVALCQRCHLKEDMRAHVINRRVNAARREREAGEAAGQMLLL